jgi:hypothetical protein
MRKILSYFLACSLSCLVALGIYAGGTHVLAQQTNQTGPGGTVTPYSCTITISSNTTTQCQPIPTVGGLRNYIQSYELYTTVAGTTDTIGLTSGTGTNCASNTAAMTPTYADTTITPANSAGVAVQLGGSGLVPNVGYAICAVMAGTTAGTVQVMVQGYVGP